MNIDDFRTRVERGVAWLDEHEADWTNRIDPGKLNLSEPCQCMLGQLHGNYWHVVAMVVRDGYKLTRGTMSNEWAAQHGFQLSDEDWSYDSFDVLTTLWRDVIRARTETYTMPRLAAVVNRLYEDVTMR